MTSRERFEAHLGKRKGFKPPSFRLTTAGAYYFDVVQIAWENWQAAERDMLERCVYVAEQGFRRALDGNEIADKLKELLNEQQH